jgi:cytochrome c-type biogenesis protein CcmH
MMLWFTLAAMTVAMLAMLLWPLLRHGKAEVSRSALEREIYRDQLDEVERERARGILSSAEAAAARTEISRQMIASARVQSADDANTETPGLGETGRRSVLIATAILIPVGAFGLYLMIGAPAEPDRPFAAREAERDSIAQHEDLEMSRVVQRLAERLKAEPDNLEGWILLARSYNAAEQFAQAAEAYREAVRLSGDSPALVGAYAEALTNAAGGIVTPEALRLFEQVNRADPDPRTRYYLGLARDQAGESQAALDTWLALEADSPPDATWLPLLRSQMGRLADELGIELASTAPPSLPQEAAPGPTEDDIAAAQAMSSGEQAEMVKSMVARLAARLEDDPGDVEGWLRLANAYRVLGEVDQAKTALSRGAAANPTAPQQARIDDAARALGADLGPAAADGRDPDAGDATEDSQTAMIRGMVDGLAARLETDPDDLAGWIRLGRSYLVLDQPVQARSAFARAVEMDPRNVNLVLTYADTILAAPDGSVPLPADSVRVMDDLLKIDGTNRQALWYVGLAEARKQDPSAASIHWQRLLAQLDPDSRDYQTVKQRLETLETRQ